MWEIFISCQPDLTDQEVGSMQTGMDDFPCERGRWKGDDYSRKMVIMVGSNKCGLPWHTGLAHLIWTGPKSITIDSYQVKLSACGNAANFHTSNLNSLEKQFFTFGPYSSLSLTETQRHIGLELKKCLKEMPVGCKLVGIKKLATCATEVLNSYDKGLIGTDRLRKLTGR